MPTDDPALRFHDILENTSRLKDYTAGMTENQFITDRKTIDAVERCLERIAEAARNLGDTYDNNYPHLDLPQLRQFGSVLRHDYDVIEPALLWGFVRDRLKPLEKMARSETKKAAQE